MNLGNLILLFFAILLRLGMKILHGFIAARCRVLFSLQYADWTGFSLWLMQKNGGNMSALNFRHLYNYKRARYKAEYHLNYTHIKKLIVYDMPIGDYSLVKRGS